MFLLSSDQRFRAVVNRDFDYVVYFDKIASRVMNFTQVLPWAYRIPGNRRSAKSR